LNPRTQSIQPGNLLSLIKENLKMVLPNDRSEGYEGWRFELRITDGFDVG